jgi:hypothetical protein
MSEAIKSTEIANAIAENLNAIVAEANDKTENPTDIEEKANAIAENPNVIVAEANNKTENPIDIVEKANAIEENRNEILRTQTRLKN